MKHQSIATQKNYNGSLNLTLNTVVFVHKMFVLWVNVNECTSDDKFKFACGFAKR